MRSKYSTEQFIAMAVEKHGDKYDYSKSVYTGSGVKLIVICPEHGEFLVRASFHATRGTGCPKCARIIPKIRKKKHYEGLGRPKKTTQEFIERSIQVHGNYYDYSETNYIDCGTSVTITCPIHGKFTQQPYSHIIGHGCKLCGSANRGKLEELKRARRIFNPDNMEPFTWGLS